MRNKPSRPYLTARDLEILRALDLSPLSAKQLRKLSSTWSEPFVALRTVRDRLQRLAAAHLIRTWRYATTIPCQPTNYYTLSRAGYELLCGPRVPPPGKRHFSEVALSRQPHTQALADFLVHTHTAAAASGIELVNCRRENSLRLDVGAESLYPDAAFDLVADDDRPLRFYVEVDGGSERLCSQKAAESIERKIRHYDRLLDASRERFRVLFVVMHGSLARLAHILEVAARTVRHADRSLVYGITLPGYLGTVHAVTRPVFLDHRRQPRALASPPSAVPLVQARSMSPAVAAC